MSNWKEYRWVIKEYEVFLANFKFDKSKSKHFTDFFIASKTKVRKYSADLYFLIEGKADDKTEIKITSERAVEYIFDAKYVATKTGIGVFYMLGIEMYAEIVNTVLQVSCTIPKEDKNRFEEQIVPRIPKGWVQVQGVYDFIAKQAEYSKQRQIIQELTTDIADTLSGDDQQLVLDHTLLHSYWNKIVENKIPVTGWTKDKLIRAHRSVVTEMLKRDVQHHFVNALDETLPPNLQKRVEAQKKRLRSTKY